MWDQSAEYVEPQFNDLFMVYRRPTVPQSFDDNGRRLPRAELGIFRKSDYENGKDLFESNHSKEWKTKVIHFTNEREFWRERFRIKIEESELPHDKWSSKHTLFARSLGADAALIQIESLIKQYGELECRRHLRTIPWYRKYFHYKRQTIWTILLITAIGIRICKLFPRQITMRSSEVA